MRYSIEAVCAGTILFLLTGACAATPTSPSSTEPPTPSATVTAPLPTVSPTLTPTRIATVAPSETPTPAPTATTTSIPTRTNTPLPTVGDPRTAVPPLSEFEPSAQMRLGEEYQFGAYFVRRWCSADLGSLAGCIVTIEAAGQPRLQFEASEFDEEWSGRDLTGDGTTEIVIHTSVPFGTAPGSLTVVSLDMRPTYLFQSERSRCRFELIDVDGDGLPEVVACDYAAASGPCAAPYWVGRSVPAILAYDANLGYRPASFLFPEYYSELLVRAEQGAAGAVPDQGGEGDGTTKCGVLPLVVLYLYLGDEDAAWAALAEYYPYPDRAEFQAYLVAAINRSPYYAPPPSSW